MKIAIAADHAGYEEKEQLKPLLDELGVQYEDLGTASPESVDYPNYARKLPKKSRAATSIMDCSFVVRAREWPSLPIRCPACARPWRGLRKLPPWLANTTMRTSCRSARA